MRQQLSQAAVGPGGEFGEDVFEIRPVVVAVELGGFDQAHQDGGAFSGLLGAHKEPVFPSEGEWPDGVFGWVVIDADTGVAQVGAQGYPAVERVVDRFGCDVGIEQSLARGLKPGLEFIQ